MKKVLICLVLLSVIGCAKAITNDRVIEEKNKCLDAGMDYEIWTRGWDGRTMFVKCIKPPQEE
jgi:hypothetical protein